MTKNEKKFWDILTNLFVGAEVKGKSGFINLMKAKQSYFKKVKMNLYQHIEETTKGNNAFKDELYDKLYSFFHRYFSESGSIYYNYTPLFYNIYTKAYDNDKPSLETNYATDYEQVISNKQDTSLFYKTQMLYYVKSDKIFKDLEIKIEKYKYIFDVSNMQGKSANEKKELVYTLENIEEDSFFFAVDYSYRGKKTKIADMLKLAKKKNISINEDNFKKAFRVFERQANIDYFINKDAKKFLTEQLNMWIYQYMFSQEAEFDLERFEQIKSIKTTALKLIDFISQFENELVKIWNKPRFVINSNIVVTMDKLKDKDYNIEKIKNHQNYKKQQEEWKELGIIQGDGVVENQYLPIDTKYFKDLQEEIEELFEEDDFDGLLIKSENYQALNTILPRYREKVDLIYIDPPFNTGDDFAYIDKFQDSTWLSLMENRLEIAKEFMSKRSSFYMQLDFNANYYGRILLNNTFSKDNFVNEITWKRRLGLVNQSKSFGANIDNILFYSKTADYLYKAQYTTVGTEDYIKERYIYKTKQGRVYKLGDLGSPSYSPSLIYEYKGYRPPKKGWALNLETMKKFDREGRINFPNDKSKRLMRRQFLDEWKGKYVQVLWDDIFPINSQAKEKIEGQLTQKPEKLLARIIDTSSINKSIILDYHVGSGSTISTAQKMNRKWIGIEMGEHFYTATLPRMKKTISGFISGISKELEKENNLKKGGLFKYYELEQYEQILRNIQYTDVPQEWLERMKTEDIKDCFLFDSKLSNAVDTTNDKYKIDLSKIYDNIDIKETIHNLVGKRPSKVTDDTVSFKDGSSYPLMQILKPLLIW